MATKESLLAVRENLSKLYGLDKKGIDEENQRLSQSILALVNPTKPLSSSTPELIDSKGGEVFVKFPEQLIDDLNEVDLNSQSYAGLTKARYLETNIEDASRLLQQCVGLRNNFRESAKSYAETSLKAAEFFLLEDVHFQEIDAGIYELPYDEAINEVALHKNNFDSATSRLQRIQWLLDDGYEDKAGGSDLSNASIIRHIEDVSSIASLQFSDEAKAAAAGKRTIAVANATKNIERAAWELTRTATEGSIEESALKKIFAERKRDFYSKDRLFKVRRARISLEMAYQQLAENTRDGSELNYHDRMKSEKAVFKTLMENLAAKLSAIEHGLMQFHGISLSDYPISSALQSQLDEATTRLLIAQLRLSEVKRKSKLEVVTLYARNGVLVGDGPDGTRNFSCEIDYVEADQSAGLLRGISLEFIGSAKKTIVAEVATPAFKPELGDKEGSYPLKVRYGRILEIGQADDVRPQFAELFWNFKPIGTWKITGTLTEPDAKIEDFAMHFWLLRSTG